MKPDPKQSSVPWTGFDVLLFFAAWFAPLIVGIAIAYFASQTATTTETKDHGHPIAQLVEQGKNSPMVFLLVFLSAVVAAPLIEELLFRMLLQGWLETKFKRRRIPGAGGIAIVIVSIFFAAIHAKNYGVIDAQALLEGLAASSAFSLLVFTMGVFYLTQIRHVRIADYLFGTQQFFRPGFSLGAGYCLLAIMFCFALNAVLTVNVPNTNVSPVPIFFFSLVLGVLYSRTQNLSYCILLHACLNGISLALLWVGAG